MYYAAYTAGLVGTWEVGMGAARALGAAGGIATQAGVAAVQTFAERDDEATWGDRASRAAFAALGLGVSMKGANVVGKAFRGLRKVVEEAPAVVEETSAATSGGGFYKMLTEGDEAIIRGAEEMHKDGVGVAVEDLKALKPGTQPPPAKVAARMDPYTPRNPVEYLRKMQAEAPASASWGVDDTLRESYKAQETAPIPQNIMQYTQRLQREKELAQQGLVNSVLEQPRSVGAAAARPRTYREVEPEFIATTPGRATVVYKEPSGRRVGYSELFYADYSGKKVKVPSRKGLRPMTKADLARETPLYEIEHLEVAPGFSASVLHDLRGQGAEYFKPGTPSQRALAKHLGGEAVQPGRYNIPSPNEGRLIETVTDPGPDRWKQALNDVKAPRPKVLREDVYNIDDALTSLKNTRRK